MTGARGKNWQQDIERVLITEEQIARRVRQLTRKIQRDFAGRGGFADEDVVLRERADGGGGDE